MGTFDWNQIMTQPAIAVVVFLFVFFGSKILIGTLKSHKETIDSFLNKQGNDTLTTNKLNEIGNTINHVQQTLLQSIDKQSEINQEHQKMISDLRLEIAKKGVS